MARTMRGHPMLGCNKKEAVEQHNNACVPQLEEQADTKEGEVVIDSKLDIDYEPEGADPSNKPLLKRRKKKRIIQKGSFLAKGTLR